MITWADWGIWLVYFMVMLLVLWFYRQNKSADYYRFFLGGFIIKVFGSVAFTLIYVYYYKFGDSFEYYKGALALNSAFSNAIPDYIDLLLSESSHDFSSHLTQYTNSLEYADTPEEWFMVKLLSPISFLAFQSYLVINLFMGLISFWGTWKLFRVFADILPDRQNIAFISAFLIPSVVFWGSGIMKDTITLAGVNYLIYALYFALIKGKPKLIFLLAAPVWFIITFKLKSYITLALLPGIILTFYYHLRSKISSDFLKLVSGPILFSGLLVISFYSLQTLSESSQKYSAKQLEWKVKGFHSWHTDVGGSSYNLGDVDYTLTGVISKAPAAMNVTFFRPYLWEARNPVVFLGAVESLIILVLFAIALYQLFQSLLKKLHQQPFLLGLLFLAIVLAIISIILPADINIWIRFGLSVPLVLILFNGLLKRLNEQPLLKGMLIFVLIFGFAIGFTSYNFGALGRYKIPILSLFTFTLLYMVFKKKKESEPI